MSRALTQGGTVNDIETDTNVAALTAQLAERDATIERLDAELAQLQEWYREATTIIVKQGLSL